MWSVISFGVSSVRAFKSTLASNFLFISSMHLFKGIGGKRASASKLTIYSSSLIDISFKLSTNFLEFLHIRKECSFSAVMRGLRYEARDS